MRTLVIDNYDSFTFNLAHYVGGMSGVAPTIIKNNEAGWNLSVLEDFDNVVISPGPGSPSEAKDFGICADVIRQAQIPVLGVCLGHQGICHVYGAQVVPAPGIFHGRASLVTHAGDVLFRGVPSPFSAARYHSLAVADLPDELEAIAWTEGEVLMGVRHRSRPLWGVQFHPESIGTVHGPRILRNFMRLTHETSPLHGTRVHWHRPDRRVAMRRLPFEVPAERAFAALYADARHAFWLDSSRTGEQRGRFSFMGDASGPLARVAEAQVDCRSVVVTSNAGREVVEGPFLDWLDHDLHAHRAEVPDLPFDFALGWVGYLGYELKVECGGELAHHSRHPDAGMIFADRAVVFDHELREIYLLALVDNGDTASATEWFDRTRRSMEELAAPAPDDVEDRDTPSGSPGTLDEGKLRHDKEHYLELISACHKEIDAGESYEICLTNMLHGTGTFRPWAAYRLLRRRNPVPFGALLRFGPLSVLSSSPERFLRVGADGAVESKPIKGTRPRSQFAPEDERLRMELANDPKDRAENLMIVDLVRHDLSQCAEANSVRVDPLFEVESYATVHQLVSTVHAQLRPDRSAVQCVRAAFPPGSMTGAPKIRTMQIIDGLEEGPRGIYSGALGYFSLTGAADLSVVIRTIIMTENEVYFGTGGAITTLSDADAEFEETAVKATPLLDLFGIEFPTSEGGGTTDDPGVDRESSRHLRQGYLHDREHDS
ncbi:aminodeoxychorismate synthase component I [Actinocrispum wychmicini]|uniref:aminodeoxychorismate synthase n=1 Tax=Actinocrispum wychmicini TaxID=1213861 RepID=A0A4R2JQ97_9PSEU|nr:aminodeoxychorismate synthase component I [Actinocrispum wychmicini]TCO59348.1 para-aminobenzoate synthetase [Actinocrispum wychmicini]